MFGDSLKVGASLIRKRFGLVVLLYSVNFLIAIFLAVPIYNLLVEHVGLTGFGQALLLEFDLIIWREIFIEIGEGIRPFLYQLLIILPVYWLWKTASQMGSIYALHSGAIWPFWRGVGFYTGPGLVVSLFFLPLKVVWVGLAVLLTAQLQLIWGGPVGGFWILGVVAPFLILTGLAILDLFQRYGRMALVIKHDTIWRAIVAGFSWPRKYRTASYLYIVWYMMALAVFAVTLSLNAALHVGTSAIVIGFMIQQVSLLTRSMVTIGWVGSEVHLFETTLVKELPLIADTDQDLVRDSLT